MKRKLVVTAALIEREGRVLLTKRLEGDELEGHWEFPGGALEEGEDLAECLARELREELGVEVEVGEEIAVVEHDYGEFEIELHLLSARIVRGNPRPLGCAGIHWFRWDEIPQESLAPADRKLLSMLRKA